MPRGLIRRAFAPPSRTIAATARQWTHHERLQHPLIQVPMALTRPSVLFDRRFLIAAGIVFAVSLYAVLKTLELNPLPDFKVGQGKPVVKMPDLYKIFGADAPSSARWVYQNQWGAVHIFPAVIGIAFLLSLDVGFSLWGGFWFGALICGYLYRAGVPVNFHNHGRNAGNGAVLAMALVIAWIGRRHYFQLIKATIGLGGDGGDPLGVWGVRLAVLGFAGFTFCLVAFGIDVWAAVLGLLIFAAFMIVIARVVAESGLANFQTPGHLYQFMHGIGIPHLFPVHAVAMMSWLGATMAYDTRVNVSGFLVQSTAMGDVGRLPRRRLFLVLLFVGLAVAGGALIGELLAFWGLEGKGRLAGSERYFQTKGLVNLYENPPRGDAGGLGMSVDQWAILVGAMLIFACYAMRRIWVGFILNPIGLVVASSWPVMVCWGSLMIGWAAKALVLRYGVVERPGEQPRGDGARAAPRRSPPRCAPQTGRLRPGRRPRPGDGPGVHRRDLPRGLGLNGRRPPIGY